MPKNKLRVVHVGCGGMSGAWLGPVTQQFRKQLEIVGLIDLDEGTARKRRDEFGLTSAHTSSDLDAMLRRLKPDIVFDCTLPKAHKRVTLTAFKHGCHVLGEKPMAENMRDARAMVAAAQRANRLYAITTQRRYMPQIREVRKLIESEKLGRLTTLNSDFYIGAHFGGFRDHMPHVLLVDMAIHHFDMARCISGADPVAVYCKEWNPAGSWYDRDASAVAIFEMSDGLVYTYRGSWCGEGMATTWEASWMLVGEGGFATWDGGDQLRAQMVKQRGGFISEMKSADIPIRASSKPSGHAAVIADFIHCIRKGGTPQTLCTDNIKSLAMVMAAVKSAETNRRVEMNI